MNKYYKLQENYFSTIFLSIFKTSLLYFLYLLIVTCNFCFVYTMWYLQWLLSRIFLLIKNKNKKKTSLHQLTSLLGVIQGGGSGKI